MDKDSSFMTSPLFYVYMALMIGLIFLEPPHLPELLVLGLGAGIYLEGRRQNGWCSAAIEWPEEFSFLSNCYYNSLRLLKWGTILSMIAALYLLQDGLLSLQQDFTLMVKLFMVMGAWLPATAGVLSLCWMLHDRWARRTGSTTISSLNPPFTQAGLRSSFRTWSWVLVDLFALISTAMLWLYQFLQVVDLPLAVTAYTLFYAAYIVTQLYVFFHYKKLLPQSQLAPEG